MDADTYQELAARTLIDEPDTTFTNDELAIMLAALELGSRVGKVIEYCKKGICHRHGFDTTKALSFVSDVDYKIYEMHRTIEGDIPAPEYRLSGNDQMLIWCALGLGGEAGEVMETISNLPDIAYHGNDLVKELGDVMWYNAALCTLIGVPMSDVMQANIDKLTARYKNGYSSEESKARVDTL